MPSGSQGDVYVPPSPDSTNLFTVCSDRTRTSPFSRVDDSRPRKRRRHDPYYPNENESCATDVGNRHFTNPARKASRKDERALMDDLMAGLGASVFDHFQVSPVKAKPVARAVRSPLKILKSVAASTIQHKPNSEDRRAFLRPTTPAVQSKPRNDRDSRICNPEDEDLASVKQDPNPELVNEDIFDVDFDLADLSAFDDDLLLKPENVDVCLFVSEMVNQS